MARERNGLALHVMATKTNQAEKVSFKVVNLNEEKTLIYIKSQKITVLYNKQ